MKRMSYKSSLPWRLFKPLVLIHCTAAVFIKKYRLFLSNPLSVIINRSFDSGIFPQAWKKSLVVPLRKNANISSLSNYRPISVLPSISKIIERVAQHQQLVDHLLSHSLLSPYQSGFRPGYCTQDVLLRVTDSWSKAMDNKK